MDTVALIIVIVVVFTLAFVCSSIKVYRAKRAAAQPRHPQQSRNIYVTDTTMVRPPYPAGTTYLSMPPATSRLPVSQPFHPTGYGWQHPPASDQYDSPPSYDEVMSRPAAERQQQQQTSVLEPFPKETTRNPGF